MIISPRSLWEMGITIGLDVFISLLITVLSHSNRRGLWAKSPRVRLRSGVDDPRALVIQVPTQSSIPCYLLILAWPVTTSPVILMNERPCTAQPFVKCVYFITLVLIMMPIYQIQFERRVSGIGTLGNFCNRDCY